MNKAKRIGLGFFAVIVVASIWRANVTMEYLHEEDRLQAQHERARNEVEKSRSSLAEELRSVEDAIKETYSTSERGSREAKVKGRSATSARQAKEQELEKFKKDHWLTRWLVGSDASKQMVALEKEVEGFACALNKANLASLAAPKVAERQVATLRTRKASIENQLTSMPGPESHARSRSSWYSVFFGMWNPKEVALERGSDTKVLSRPALVPRPFSYELPTIELTPAPIRITTLFDLLDVRSARDLEKLITSFSKELQDAVIRAYKRKEEGTLVDLTVGCTKVTLNKPVAEALWKKYQYFLAQTDFQCEIAPTSDFRDYIKQRELKRKEAKGGPPVAPPLDSKHVVGDAVDQSSRCQNQSDRRVPFDFDKDGGVILVRLDGKGLRPANVLEDSSTRKAIVDRRKAEFPDDYKRLQASGGDLKSWEVDQYRTALEELLWQNGMAIYGAHVMSFEAGLKAGLVGAYCSVQGGGAGGPRPDPIHSELTIGKSKAECGAALGGKAACYRVDGTGKPDCWRGSPKWNEQVDSQRRRQWGARYADLYGPNRLDRYLPLSSRDNLARR